MTRAIPPPLLFLLFFVDILYGSLLNSDESVQVLSCSVSVSQVSVIIVISELVLCISSLIKFSLCF